VQALELARGLGAPAAAAALAGSAQGKVRECAQQLAALF
jgi:hypothetical protein